MLSEVEKQVRDRRLKWKHLQRYLRDSRKVDVDTCWKIAPIVKYEVSTGIIVVVLNTIFPRYSVEWSITYRPNTISSPPLLSTMTATTV